MKKLIGFLFFLVLGLMVFLNSCNESGKIFTILQDKCIACRACVTACGFHAISYTRADSTSQNYYKVTIDPKKCVGCGECVLVCPVDAITSASTSNQSDDNDNEEENATTTTSTSTVTPTTTTSTTTTTTTSAKTYAVSSSRCTGCGRCLGACSYGALSFSGGKAVINASKCTGCGKCAARCPRSAIYQQ